LHAAADERGAALNRDHRRSGRRVQEQVDGRVLADTAEAGSPILLQFGDAMLERLGVGDRAPAGAGEEGEPGVDGVHSPPRWRLDAATAADVTDAELAIARLNAQASTLADSEALSSSLWI
jgi:hypothetical protein